MSPELPVGADCVDVPNARVGFGAGETIKPAGNNPSTDVKVAVEKFVSLGQEA